MIEVDMALAETLIADSTMSPAEAKRSLKNIRTPQAYTKIAMQSKTELLTELVCLRIDNEQVLYELLNAKDVSKRCTAHSVFAIKNPALLTRLLMTYRIDGNGLGHNNFLRKITDESVLLHIAEHYPHAEIKGNAKRILNDIEIEKQLKHIASVSDNSTLMRLVLDASESKIWQAAMDKISDQQVLYQLAVMHKDGKSRVSYQIKDAATKRITDHNLLVAIAVQYKAKVTENWALNQLNNDQQFFEVARAGLDSSARDTEVATEDTREVATQRIKTPSMLATIALNDPHPKVRSAALTNILDQQVLKQAATEGDNEWERTVATSNLRDRTTLELLQKKTGKQAVIASLCLALLEVDHVPEKPVIKLRRATFSRSYSYYSAGTKTFEVKGERITITIHNSVTDENFSFIAYTDYPGKLNTTRKKKKKPIFIRAHITQQNLVIPFSNYLRTQVTEPQAVVLATTSISDLLRAAALKNVATKGLVESAIVDSSSLVRRVAVERLTNSTLLERVVLNERVADIRETAIQKISNIELLQRIMSNKKTKKSERNIVRQRLVDLELLK